MAGGGGLPSFLIFHYIKVYASEIIVRRSKHPSLSHKKVSPPPEIIQGLYSPLIR